MDLRALRDSVQEWLVILDVLHLTLSSPAAVGVG